MKGQKWCLWNRKNPDIYPETVHIVKNNNNGGIIVRRDSTDNIVANNRVIENGWHGIRVDFHSHRTTIKNNTVLGHKKEGLQVFGSSNCKVIGNTVKNNGYSGPIGGIRLSSRINNPDDLYGCSDNLVKNNNFINNGSLGIHMEIVNNTRIVNNTVAGLFLAK